jgi:hypothetical protein
LTGTTDFSTNRVSATNAMKDKCQNKLTSCHHFQSPVTMTITLAFPTTAIADRQNRPFMPQPPPPPPHHPPADQVRRRRRTSVNSNPGDGLLGHPTSLTIPTTEHLVITNNIPFIALDRLSAAITTGTAGC